LKIKQTTENVQVVLWKTCRRFFIRKRVESV